MNKLWAIIDIEQNCITGILGPDLSPMPAVTVVPEVAKKLQDFVIPMLLEQGKKVKLVEYQQVDLHLN